MNKTGFFDITEIASPNPKVSGVLSVRLNKGGLGILLVLAFVIFFGTLMLLFRHEITIFIKICFLILSGFNISYFLGWYLIAAKTYPYLLIESDGISVKGKKYNWSEIEEIKYERYKTNSYAQYLYIILHNKQKISIELFAMFLNADIEKIAAHINHYNHK